MAENLTPTRDLNEWVDYIQTLHAREIDLSLERVTEVYQRMMPTGVKFSVLTIAGTNGKGSTAEIISSIYREAGYKVGKYTSPHLLKFNERINVNGIDVSDDDLIKSFNRIERYRGEINLTFFEFGTLCAIDIFVNNQLDVVILEVGLGGRLDATNILDADVAVLTSISIDHTAWLGNNLESIAAEKIAIARQNAPCVLGLTKLPRSIIDYCKKVDVQPLVLGEDFNAVINSDNSSWEWQSELLTFEGLPLPFNQTGHQIRNASVSIQAVLTLEEKLPVSSKHIHAGLKHAHLRGRCELVSRNPHIVLDVAHNVDSVLYLSNYVAKLNIKGRIIAVCGMLQDKQISETLSQLVSTVEQWHFASINNERGATADNIESSLQEIRNNNADINNITIKSFKHETAVEAFKSAQKQLKKDDCLIVFGSFYIVSDIITLV